LDLIEDTNRIKVQLHPRTPFSTIARDNDIVLSYQYNCELNNLYFDTVTSYTILIHNSSMLKDIGWYYKEHSISSIGDLVADIHKMSVGELNDKFARDGDFIQKQYST
jgi:hypothetical protein